MPFQSRPKVPIQKLAPSKKFKRGAILARLLGRAALEYMLPIFEHLQSKCYFMRAAARNAEKC